MDTSKRVRYNSESEDDRPARDRRTLQEQEREDRDLNGRKARERRADRGRSSNRERSRDRDDDRRQDSRKCDSRKGGGHGSRHNRARGSSQPRSSSQPRYNKGSKSPATVDSVRAHAPASDIVAAIQPLIALPALPVVYSSPYVRFLYLRMCNLPSLLTRLITFLVISLLYSVKALKTR